MNDKTIEIYTSDTAEAVDQFRLDDTHVYTSMTFNSQGNFYLLRDFNWDAVIITADPLTGEEQDVFPWEQSHIVETVTNDLVTDEDGNIYVLFSMNTGQIAIHQFNQKGELLQRFGKLTSDVNDWAEGSFLDPRALAVSPDGRLVLVADGYDDQAYLTCFLMEIDE
jgi:WD40 repeat protein